MTLNPVRVCVVCPRPPVELMERVEDVDDSIRCKVVESTCLAAHDAVDNVPEQLLFAIGTRLLDKKVCWRVRAVVSWTALLLLVRGVVAVVCPQRSLLHSASCACACALQPAVRGAAVKGLAQIFNHVVLLWESEEAFAPSLSAKTVGLARCCASACRGLFTPHRVAPIASGMSPALSRFAWCWWPAIMCGRRRCWRS